MCIRDRYNFPATRSGPPPVPTLKVEKRGTTSSDILAGVIEELTRKGKVNISVEEVANITGLPLEEGQLDEAVEAEDTKEPVVIKDEVRDEGGGDLKAGLDTINYVVDKFVDHLKTTNMAETDRIVGKIEELMRGIYRQADRELSERPKEYLLDGAMSDVLLDLSLIHI